MLKNHRSLGLLAIVMGVFVGLSSGSAADPSAARVSGGLLAFYRFDEGEGRVIRDHGPLSPALDLQVEDPGSVRWTDDGLELVKPTRLRSAASTKEMLATLRQANELTVEAWVRPARRDQAGPARILTFSKDSSNRNFTLGQDGGKYDFRLRTTRASTNGLPSTATREELATPKRTHIVFVRHRSGTVRWYINGQSGGQAERSGDFSNWQAMSWMLGNEASGDRPWLGTYSLVAVYARALSSEEVRTNFDAGPAGTSAKAATAIASRQFQRQVAPLLATRCVGCHNAAERKGGLDLSRHAGLLAGGDSGAVFNKAKPLDSEIWRQVADGDMPKDAPPLSEGEKEALQDWLKAGAVGPGGVLDPSDYLNLGDGKNYVQRLTVEEYVATVKATVGVDIESAARERLPKDLRADGFRNTAYNLNVDLSHIEAYGRLAEMIVEKLDVVAFAKKYGGKGRLDADEVRKAIERMGRWVLRGPLNDREVGAYAQIAVSVAENGGSYEEAMRYIVQAMLQAPRFLYRIENQQGAGDNWNANSYELASRMSYIVSGVSPDAELAELAESGRLYDREVVEQQLQRMLKDPRAIDRSLDFADQWLRLSRLDTMQPSPDHFPNWKEHLAGDMRRETLAFFSEVCWKQRRPLADLLDAQVTFVTPRLAKHYGMKEQQGKPDRLIRVDLTKTPSRGGILTQGSVLTVGGDEASMVTRGLFVLQDILRGAVSDPPPCVDTTPVPTKKGLTQRGIAESRIANASCGGCHVRFEPLAFGLERYDGLGAYHRSDHHGNPLREDGKVLVPGAAKAVSYDTSEQLMSLLANSPRVQQCITWKVAQFALGRPLVAADVPELKRIDEASRKAGGTYANVVTAIVLSDLVQSTRSERQ